MAVKKWKRIIPSVKYRLFRIIGDLKCKIALNSIIMWLTEIVQKEFRIDNSAFEMPQENVYCVAVAVAVACLSWSSM